MNLKEIKETIVKYIWSYNATDAEVKPSYWHHFLQIIAMVVRDWMGGMLTLRSMSLVYTTLLSIVPLLAVSLSVLKGFGVHNQLEPALVALLEPLGEKSIEISSKLVGFVDNMKIGVLGALGLALLLFTVVTLIQKIEAAFNATWRLHSSRNLMQRFSNYLSVVLVGPVLLFSAAGITASLGSHSILVAINELPFMSNAIRLIGYILPYLLVIGAFTFIYILVPNTRVKPLSALYGAVVAGILWKGTGFLFTVFMGGSTKYTAIYSGFAITLLFMIWLFLSWLILLIGSSIAYYHQHPERLHWGELKSHLSARMREQVVLQLMVSIGRYYDARSDLPTTIDNLANYQQVPVEMIGRMLDALEQDELVRRSSDIPPCYLPARSISRISLNEILRSSREAESADHVDVFVCDASVSSLLNHVDERYTFVLGDRTLADFLEKEDA
ncbi:MAG: YihY/virulence factor BrkB family protein [Gammaproteobacteria bacterium]